MPVVIQGEIALPTNPNCILFSTAAGDALPVGWLALQRVAWSALEQFYSASGIDCVAWFGRRAWLNRRNEPEEQILLMFVLDGPASSDDISLVEGAIKRSNVLWSQKSMESIPPDAFPSLCVKSGKMYQLWSRLAEEPRCLSVEAVDGRTAIVSRSPTEVGSADFLPYVRHVTFARRAVRDEDWRMERMRIAFAHHFSQSIVEADGVLHADEREFMQRVFPEDMMTSMGMDQRAAYNQALNEAKVQLPLLLGHHDKLAMIGLFFSVCHSDGTLDAREMRVLKEAAAILGLEGNQVVSYLTKLW